VATSRDVAHLHAVQHVPQTNHLQRHQFIARLEVTSTALAQTSFKPQHMYQPVKCSQIVLSIYCKRYQVNLSTSQQIATSCCSQNVEQCIKQITASAAAATTTTALCLCLPKTSWL
jgi:hypothetical protein